jgi:lipoprotein-anchoring transpeptidase ErfK/SrfK
MRTALATAAAALSLVVPLSGNAAGQEATPTVSLETSADTVVFGDPVTLSGQIAPAARGETVEIRDEADAVVASATTDAAGAFSTSLVPDRDVELHAAWQTASSDPVRIRVRAVVTVRMGAVRLFDAAVVRGSVQPAVPGARVDVSVLLGGHEVATRSPRLGTAGGFETTFPVQQAGTYRVRARFDDDAHLPGGAVTEPSTTPLPSLHEGSSGPFVRALERRLVELHYRLVGVNSSYDARTADAVVAFRKVQGMSRVFTVDAAVWRALADPRVPRPRVTAKAFHIEVDQTRQVLYTVDAAEITNILHISTGKPSTPTHDGSFRVARKIAGYSPNQLFYPSYFDGNRAIHGWPDVPTYAASHGCVRVPYWNAQWIFGLDPIGTRVIVYHS